MLGEEKQGLTWTDLQGQRFERLENVCLKYHAWVARLWTLISELIGTGRNYYFLG